MNLPGSPRTHVWTGLAVALVGVLVGGYAYTSWRIYYIKYLPVALAGLALLIVGSALAGYGQANRPRLGGKARAEDEGGERSTLDRLRDAIASLAGGEDDAEASETTRTSRREAGDGPQDPASEDQDRFSGALDRVRAWLPSRWDGEAEPDVDPSPAAPEPAERDREGPRGESIPVELDLECPECGEQFSKRGRPPMDVACPSCDHRDEVTAPDVGDPRD